MFLVFIGFLISTTDLESFSLRPEKFPKQFSFGGGRVRFFLLYFGGLKDGKAIACFGASLLFQKARVGGSGGGCDQRGHCMKAPFCCAQSSTFLKATLAGRYAQTRAGRKKAQTKLRAADSGICSKGP